MINAMITILIAIVAIALFCWSMLSLSAAAGRVHEELDKFMAEANASIDINTLHDINKRLISYAKAECYHKHFGTHAKEVNVYICGKIAGIKMGKESI